MNVVMNVFVQLKGRLTLKLKYICSNLKFVLMNRVSFKMLTKCEIQTKYS